ncbi:inner membrane mitochondrial protein mitofilin isoform X1 [Rhodnius prolixus]|uniref:MICOS complex subunit MIC60 n=1 Tax=Rhodnius neglectus TaxID=72488 RepID=A0A0P4VUY0_9HEMI
MFRHCSKFPFGTVTKSGVQRQYHVRFYKTTSYNRDKSKQEQKECPKDGSGRGFYYSLGAVVLGTGAVVAYAKHDPEFRAWLSDNVPGSDGFIAFVTAEETSHIDYLVRYIKKLKQRVWNEIMNMISSSNGPDESKSKKVELGPCDSKGQPYVPPESTFQPLADSEPKEEAKKPVEDAAKEKAEEEAAKAVDALHPTSLASLEKEINNAATAAIQAFKEAVCILRDHAESVYSLVEQSVEKADPRIWSQLKKKGEEKERLIRDAENNANEAIQRINELKSFLDDPKLPGGPTVRERAKQNLDKLLTDIEDAKGVFERERAKVAVTDKYWDKVQEARKHFAEELEILFPNVRLSERNMKLAEGEIDLFILYAFQNILYYQKELTKLDTVSALRLKQALDDVKKNTDVDLTEECVEQEIEKVKRKYGLEFQKRMLMLRAECERNMRQQMKRQAEAHADHLEEAMEMKEKEMERKMRREMEDKLIEEKNKFKEEIAAMVGRLRGMDDAMKTRATQDQRAQQSQVLWSACQSLEAALRAPARCEKPIHETLRPLQSEVNAISKAAAPGDELVEVVIKSLPAEVTARGVYNDMSLKERFLNVERVAKRVALLPEGGASLPLMLLSYLQSLFIITPANPIPAYELANEPFEPAKFNTFDILQRARYWLDRGDFFQALRYMNLLEGAPRVVASEWMREARIYLETLQAAKALMAHASAAGLSYS